MKCSLRSLKVDSGILTLVTLLLCSSSLIAQFSDALPETMSPASAICPCTVTQGNYSTTLPFFSNAATDLAFYAYNNPFGSSSNTGLEISEHMLIMIYENSNTGALSLIFILDIAPDATGGTMNMTLECMNTGTSIVLSDDVNEFTGNAPTYTGNFVWSSCCTDGGIVGGISCGQSFVFDIQSVTGINTISLVSGNTTNPTYEHLPKLACPIIINCGGQACCDYDLEVETEVVNASCQTSENGEIHIEDVGECNPPLSYLWSTGATGESATDLLPGAYAVTITDIHGCTLEESFVVGYDFNDPVPSINGPTWLCEGEEIELFVAGNYIWYEWSTGANTYNININQPGVYEVTVSNAGGCTGSAILEIEIFPAPQPIITGPTEICAGGMSSLDAGPDFWLYDWSTGANTQVTQVTDPGIYTVVVTSDQGCTGEATITLEEIPAPEPTVFGPDSLCHGQTAILEVDDVYESYLWSSGDSTVFVQISSPGTYYITVTDDAGCTGTAEWQVHSQLAEPLMLEGDSLFCQGDSIVLSSSPNFSNYLWSTGDTLNNIQVSAPGPYYLLVEDVNGCRDSAHIILDTLPAVLVSISGDLSLCPGISSVLAATPSFPQYQWSNGATDSTITVTQPGIIHVEVWDENGCSGRDSVMLIALMSDTTMLSVSSCQPQDTGVFVTTLVNQAGCDSIVIRDVRFVETDSTFLFPETCDPTQAGEQISSFTNQFGCDSIVVAYAFLLAADTTHLTGTTCDPGQALMDTILLSNQVGCDSLVFVELVYAGIDTTWVVKYNCDSNAVGMQAAVYAGQHCDSVVVTDTRWSPYSLSEETMHSCAMGGPASDTLAFTGSTGCDSFHIIRWMYSDLEAEFTLQQERCAGNQDGAIQVEVMGGVADYAFRLEGQPWQDAPYFPGLAPGAYTVYVRDAMGCERQYAGLLIEAGALLTLNVGPDHEVDFGAFIDLTAISNIANIMITWDALDPLSCATCPNTQLGPITTSQTVSATALSAESCVSIDHLQVTLRELKIPAVYIPSSFSPNDDGINDIFSVYGNDAIAGVDRMAIFDRWGNALFEAFELPLNDPSAGWDGFYRGKRMDPGVYVYVVEIRLANGNTRLYKGDVTLVR